MKGDIKIIWYHGVGGVQIHKYLLFNDPLHECLGGTTPEWKSYSGMSKEKEKMKILAIVFGVGTTTSAYGNSGC